MRHLYLLIVIFMTAGFVSFAQESNAVVPNYELAARYSPNKMRNMVFSTSVDPHWMKNSDRFWYTYETSEGKQYYIVDPVKGTKTNMFDNAQMAMDMSRLTGDPFDAKHLSIQKLKFIKNETAIQFQVKSKLVEEEEKDKDEEKEEKEKEDDMEEEKEKKKKKPKKKKMIPKIWHFEYDFASKTLRLLEDYEAPEEHTDWATIAPDSSYVLFSKHHNLYWMDWENYLKTRDDDKDTTIVEHQWTEDGEKDYAYGGFSRGQDNEDMKENKDKRKRVFVTWSHDFKKFSINRTDMRKVGDLWVINNTKKPRPTLESYKYVMPGEKEAGIDELYIFDFPSKEQVKIKADTFKDQSVGILRAPFIKKTRDDEMRFSRWLSSNADEVYFTRTSRDLKRIDICRADTKTGEVVPVIEERLNTYVEIRTPYLLKSNSDLIHWSERDGWAHFYLFDKDGNLKNQITKGAFHCQSIEAVDEANRVLYFTANGREEGEDPYYYHLYRINFDGSGLKLLNPGDYNHSGSMDDEGRFIVDNYSRVNTVPASALYNNQGRKILDLETADLSKLFESGYKFPEPFKVKAADGITDIYGVMYKPFDFDSTKKYPIIEYVYPGPQTEAVSKSFSSRMNRTDRMAQVGFIVVTLGNRGGHPARSKWYHNFGYGNLRDYGLADKKVAAEQLAYRHDFIDIDKVGIFGHSGGGFMSTAAMLVYPDFFKVAVSSSGNHENSIYNRWWSEKHHGIKEVVDDEGNVSFVYKIDGNSVLAKNLKGKLLLTTGDMDNNVHPAGTIKMAKALIQANKRFDYFLFPGQRHGYGNMTEYFFWMKVDYFSKHLLGSSDSSADILQIQRDKAMSR